MILLFLSCIWALLALNWGGAKGSLTNFTAAVDVLSSSHVAPEGFGTNISCIVSGQSFDRWTNPSGQTLSTDSSQRIHVVNDRYRHDLIIKRMNRTDKGTYQCRGNLQSSTVTLYVEYPPSIIFSESTTTVTWTHYADPKQVQLKCKFDGYPTPSVKFFKDGKDITSGVTNGTRSAVYRFRATNIDYYGFVSCMGTNSRGESTHYMEVSKAGPPEPPAHIQLRVGCDYVRVHWVPPLSNRGSTVTKYRIELLKGGKLIEGEDLDTSKLSRNFFGLEEVANYALRMNAKNGFGSGAWSEDSFKTKEMCAGAMFSPSLVLLAATLVITIATMC